MEKATGHVYEAIYGTGNLYTIEASAIYIPHNIWELLKALFSNPVVIAVTLCILLIIITIVLILFQFAKSKDREKNKNKYLK